jgi:hypothetical protein
MKEGRVAETILLAAVALLISVSSMYGTTVCHKSPQVKSENRTYAIDLHMNFDCYKISLRNFDRLWYGWKDIINIRSDY